MPDNDSEDFLKEIHYIQSAYHCDSVEVVEAKILGLCLKKIVFKRLSGYHIRDIETILNFNCANYAQSNTDHKHDDREYLEKHNKKTNITQQNG